MATIYHLKILLVCLLCFYINGVYAQVSIAPSFVFIDERSGIGNLYVTNSGTDNQEVSVSFRFGYPASDSLGNQIMVYNDTAAFRQHALDPVIRAFPGKFILPGGQHQTVRIQVFPSRISKDGFYFSRLIILARPQTPDVNNQPGEEIAARVKFSFEQITAVFYRKGQAITGLTVEQLNISQKNKSLVIVPHLKRYGNAPFIGSVSARLLDNTGKTAAEFQTSTTVYFSSARRLEMDVSDVSPGEYLLELRFDSRRNDMISSNLARSEQIVHQTKLVINECRN